MPKFNCQIVTLDKDISVSTLILVHSFCLLICWILYFPEMGWDIPQILEPLSMVFVPTYPFYSLAGQRFKLLIRVLSEMQDLDTEYPMRQPIGEKEYLTNKLKIIIGYAQSQESINVERLQCKVIFRRYFCVIWRSILLKYSGFCLPIGVLYIRHDLAVQIVVILWRHTKPPMSTYLIGCKLVFQSFYIVLSNRIL